MKYVSVNDEYPRDGVDVNVLISGGKHGVARYWHLTGKWLTADERLNVNDVVVKWKYEDAKRT